MGMVERGDEESSGAHGGEVCGMVQRLVIEHRRTMADAVAPLAAEAERVAQEIAALREAARRKVWEMVVQTREIHARVCDATARLEHLQLDIRERTGEVRLPSVPMPFPEFLLTEIRRFVIAVEQSVEQRSAIASGW